VKLAVALMALPALFWPHGVERAPDLKAAGIERIAVPAAQADVWRAQGFTVDAVTDADLSARQLLAAPGIITRPAGASATRSPWASLNGWRVLRNPASKYVYELPAGSAPLAAAEAFAYGADTVLKIDQADLQNLGRMLTFLKGLPAVDLPGVADFGVIDDGTAEVGEVMNMLVRRNLLFRAGPKPFSELRVNVRLGTPEYPRSDAADPSAFALKVRRQLTDDQRSLRVYGSDTVVGRLTADATRARLHLLDYAGREVEGLRIRVRGTYAAGEANLPDRGRVALLDHAAASGFTEFSLPVIRGYAVIDLRQN
jgi:hypothetical protein